MTQLAVRSVLLEKKTADLLDRMATAYIGAVPGRQREIVEGFHGAALSIGMDTLGRDAVISLFRAYMTKEENPGDIRLLMRRLSATVVSAGIKSLTDQARGERLIVTPEEALVRGYRNDGT